MSATAPRTASVSRSSTRDALASRAVVSAAGEYGPAWSANVSPPASTTASPYSHSITAIFGDGRVDGHSGVNSYGGEYVTGSGGSFEVGEIVSTLMAGPEPAMRAETIYTELLKQAREYTVDGDMLTLSDANGNKLLIYSADK